MATNMIEHRGTIPAIVGTRISVDDVLGYLLDPDMTEESIGRLLSLTTRQVAAARSYILANPDTTLIRHRELEERPEPVNPPVVVERAKRTHEALVAFKVWLEGRKAEDARMAAENAGQNGRTPSFKEWLAEQEAGQVTHP